MSRFFQFARNGIIQNESVFMITLHLKYLFIQSHTVITSWWTKQIEKLTKWLAKAHPKPIQNLTKQNQNETQKTEKTNQNSNQNHHQNSTNNKKKKIQLGWIFWLTLWI